MAVVKKTVRNAHVARKKKHPRDSQKNQHQPQVVEPRKEPKNKKTLVIAQEIKFAKLLSCNDKKVRDKVLKKLKNWLTVRSQSSFAFTEEDFMRLWKGLYYCMWMSDKPLVQEELAESLSKLVHCFNHLATALLYTKCTLKTLAVEWFGLDHHRLDKFQMLVRRIIRQIFQMCKKRSWNGEWVSELEKVFEDLLLDSKVSLGFILHITELYMEELAKVSNGNIPEEVVTELVRPFAIQLAGMTDEREIRHVMKHIFRYLIFQSDVGLDYVEKFEAWKHAGFPEGRIDAMVKVEVSDDEGEEVNSSDPEKDVEEEKDVKIPSEKSLDPRAGRVNVELPQLPFDPKSIAELVMEYRFHPSSTTKTRKQIVRIAKEFTELSEGKMPLGVKEVRIPEARKSDTDPKKAARKLVEFERELYSDTIRGKRKQKKNGQILSEDDASHAIPKKKPKTEKLSSGNKRIEDNTEFAVCLNGDVENHEELNADDGDEIPERPKKKRKIKIERIVHDNMNPNDTKGEKKSISVQEDVPRRNRKNKEKIKKMSVSQNPVIKANDVAESGECFSLKRLENRNKKLKTKRLNSSAILSNIHLEDGIDDFSNFLNSMTPVKGKRPKKNSSGGSWNISNNDSPPTPSTSPSVPKDTSENVLVITKEVVSPQKNGESSNVATPRKAMSDEDMLMTKGIQWLTPVVTRLDKQKPELETPKASLALLKTASPSSSAKKRVKIVLQRNTAQHTSEYMRQLRQSPAIPYDANRKPPAGVLKPSPIPSPVNPFYKRNCK